jgi:hypothetical protein
MVRPVIDGPHHCPTAATESAKEAVSRAADVGDEHGAVEICMARMDFAPNASREIEAMPKAAPELPFDGSRSGAGAD